MGALSRPTPIMQTLSVLITINGKIDFVAMPKGTTTAKIEGIRGMNEEINIRSFVLQEEEHTF